MIEENTVILEISCFFITGQLLLAINLRWHHLAYASHLLGKGIHFLLLHHQAYSFV